jgi:predicted RNA methylase
VRAVYRKIRKSLRIRGPLGTVRFLGASGIRLVRGLAPNTRRARARRRASDEEFDRKYGVDTGGVIPLSQLSVDADNWVFGVQYEPVGAAVDFSSVLANVDVPYESFTFVDLGAGKGRALLLASLLPFKKIVGVEFSRELLDVAAENLRRWPVERKRCRDIELLCMDAGAYQFPDGPLVLYMYNPFGPPVMERVIDNIAAAVRRAPRRIVIVYFTPRHADRWDRLPFLRRVREEPGYCVYDTRTAQELAAARPSA